jgi:DNA-directed RNA polymerase specialized sigma24 family protein
LRTEPLRPSGEAGDGWGRAAAYDAYADGLHTYAIWSLRDHDAAVDALYCAFVIADRNITQLRQPEQIQPWMYAILRRECMLRTSAVPGSPASSTGASAPAGGAASATASLGAPSDGSGSLSPASGRLRPPSGAADPSGSLASLERNLRRAEFHSLEWPESEGLAPTHREILELTIRHGLDSQGLGLVLGLGQSGRALNGSGTGSDFGGAVIGSVGSQGFGVLADAWRELERSLAAVAVAKASREHCAQLAELTFGWSGRLNATLRAPLTDHVDGCTRCQHYLHTVIGTPAAPTILPFVAAPRALREILLDELHDPGIALRAGIDHELVAARIQRFAPDGFPAIGEPVPVRRRGGRRAAPKTGAPRRGASARGGGNVSARGGATEAARATGDVGRAVAEMTAETTHGTVESASETLPRRTPGANRPSIDAPTRGAPSGARTYGSEDDARARDLQGDALSRGVQGDARERRSDSGPQGRPALGTRGRARTGTGAHGRLEHEDAETSGVYRAPGSWAARVLPADATTEWLPIEDEPPTPSTPRTGAGRARPRRAGPSAIASGEQPRFIATASGRFAFRAPHSAEAPATAFPAAGSPTTTLPTTTIPAATAPATATAPLPRFATPAAEAVRGPDGKPRPRHKSRPVRQAVLSAVALGTVGAAAAASAALLGFVSENHSPQLLDTAPSQDPISSTARGGGLTVSVSTPAAPGTSAATHSSISAGGGTGSGVTGTVGSVKSSGPGTGTGSGSGVNAADFHVSVNQRAADPNSVAILLRNTGSVPIAWSARTGSSWIVLSQSSGTLAAGQSVALTATATNAAPAGQWTSTVTFSPGGAVVTLHGGATPPTTSAPPSSAPPTSSSPSSPPTTSTPTPTPSSTPSSSAASGASPSAVSPSESGTASGRSSISASASASSSAGSGNHRKH